MPFVEERRFREKSRFDQEFCSGHVRFEMLIISQMSEIKKEESGFRISRIYLVFKGCETGYGNSEEVYREEKGAECGLGPLKLVVLTVNLIREWKMNIYIKANSPYAFKLKVYTSVKLSMLSLFNIRHSYGRKLLNLFMMRRLCTVGVY